jgi:hypothetical protein
MSVPPRTPDELQEAPALATLPALSACIDAFLAALGIAHPCIDAVSRCAFSPRETAAQMLYMYLDTCQHLLHEYDQLTFDGTYWYCSEPEDQTPLDPDDDIPF